MAPQRSQMVISWPRLLWVQIRYVFLFTYFLYWDFSEYLLFVLQYLWVFTVCTEISLSIHCLYWDISEYLLFLLRYLWVFTVCTEISLNIHCLYWDISEYLLFGLRYLWVLSVCTEISLGIGINECCICLQPYNRRLHVWRQPCQALNVFETVSSKCSKMVVPWCFGVALCRADVRHW